MKIDQVHDVLIVVDVQNDFCPGGMLPVPYAYEIIPKINWIAKKFDNVILTQDWHPEGHTSFASTHGTEPFTKVGNQVYWPDHCVQGTKGADFHPGLDVPHAQLIVRKGIRKNLDSYSAFIEADGSSMTGLTGYVRTKNFNRFFVVGLALDYCVKYTARDARMFYDDVFVIQDACRCIGDIFPVLEDFKNSGINLITTDNFNQERKTNG